MRGGKRQKLGWQPCYLVDIEIRVASESQQLTVPREGDKAAALQRPSGCAAPQQHTCKSLSSGRRKTRSPTWAACRLRREREAPPKMSLPDSQQTPPVIATTTPAAMPARPIFRRPDDDSRTPSSISASPSLRA